MQSALRPTGWRVHGATLRGVDGVLVGVEVDAGAGIPSFHIVGQPDRVVQESRDRVRAAFRNSPLEFPPGRVTVNLAPSDLPKTGTALDLAIAVAIADARLVLPEERLRRTLLIGELGLRGEIHGVRGALSLVASAAGRLPEAIVPPANLLEARIHPGVRSAAARSFEEVIAALRDERALSGVAPPPVPPPPSWSGDLADVRGQTLARRALEVAAAGGHNLLLVGPPGSGKTLLASRLPGLLPALTFEEALEATRVHSVAGLLGDQPLVTRAPFRAPHHSTTLAGMIGGGSPIRPGEISLAHQGVLFLDELPEFSRSVLEALRQPLEEGRIVLVRAHGAIVLRSRFQLVAAMNPCPCGYRGDPARECTCDDGSVLRYRARVSGPLLDRIDMKVPVPRVRFSEITAEAALPPESSACVRARVEAARARQAERGALNRDLAVSVATRRGPTALDPPCLALLERAAERLTLSLRAQVRILRVARTIADLAGAPSLRPADLAEAIALRS